jgi:hypothetical protein
MTAITALNVRLGMDVSDFAEGANLARAETNRVASIMRQSEPAAKKYQRDLELLNKAFSETGKQGKDYANALEFLKNKYNQTTPSTNKATQAIDQIKQSMLSAVPGGRMLANALKGPAGAALAAAAAIGVLAKGVKDAAARIDETAKAAKTAGLAYSDLVAIQMLASESAGVDSSTINRGMREMSKRLAEARVEGGKLADQLKSVGINVDELASKDPAEQFRVIADVIRNTPDKAEQLRIATLAVGKAGAEMVEVFRQGGDALDKARKESERLGTALEAEAVAAVEAMNDSWGRAGMAVQGIWNSITTTLAPALKNVADLTTDFFVLVRQAGAESERLVPVFSAISAVVNTLIDGFRGIIAIISDSISLFGSMPGWIMGGELNTSFAESNRLLDEMDARSNGVADATKRAAEEAEALAIKAMRAAEEAEKLEQRYEDQVRQLQIQSLELAGHAELARQQQLQAEGYTQQQIESLMAMEKQNQAMRDRAEAEKKAQQEAIQHEKELAKLKEQQDKERQKQLEEIERAFTLEVQQAMAAAKKHFEDQKKKDDERRKAIAAGPSSMEAGSAEAARFMADQINQRIAEAAVPERVDPTQAEIAAKTREMLIEQRQQNATQAKELKAMQDLLVEFKQNGFRRHR